MSDNASLRARREAATPRGVGITAPFFVQRAENSELWDVEGRRYVDFAGGIAVLNTGHRHPKVMAAVEAQLARFTHTAFQVNAYESYVELAEKLNARAPFSGPAKTIFFTTGGEALENAVKIARAHTGRSGVITFTGAFHGRTMLTMAMTGKVAPYKKKFGPMPAEVWHLPFPNPIHGVTVKQTLDALGFLFRADVEPERVAAIVVEPVQGEGGFYETPTELFAELRKICDAHGIVLIADEVQTGFGRTGKLFAIEHTGIEPDLVTMAKSLGGGFPISGVLGRAEIMDAPEPGGLGGTYGGSPIACAAALAVLDVIDGEKLLDRANAIGGAIKGRLETFATRNDMVPITAIRGRGAMIGFDIVKSHGAYEPDAEATKRVTTAALDAGLILLSCGVHANVIRILVPLTVSDAVLEDGLKALETALIAARG
jgi:4-aminobutyrate aminotransferase/(S)-3-amino-2-methylpropionate transaminase